MPTPKNPYYNESEAVEQVGPGWSSLVKEVFAVIRNRKYPLGVIGVKERFGQLRIYTEYYVPEVDEVIAEVGHRSTKICEQCGQKGKIRVLGEQTFKTLCEQHLP